MKKLDKSKQGKKNRQSGSRFEAKTRRDLENKGWVISRWGNNVELPTLEEAQAIHMGHNKWIKRLEPVKGKLIQAKSNKFNMRTCGFPDFIAFKFDSYDNLNLKENLYHIHGVEVKSTGYLTKEEKSKCDWLLENNIFSKILVASKSKERGEIIYKEYGKM